MNIHKTFSSSSTIKLLPDSIVKSNKYYLYVTI